MIIGLVIGAIYVVGYVIVFRKVVWIVAEDSRSSYTGKLDNDDWAFAVIVGFLVTIFWPIVVPFYMSRNHMYLLASPPKSVKKELELKEREKKIKELERELGIK
jgi:hypothetical protein